MMIKGKKIRCGRCIMCKKLNALNWAQRVNDELATNNGKGCVVTLTYKSKDDNYDTGLCKRTAQKFVKRLRKNTGKKIKYLICGEYGEQEGRPHLHALLIGINGKELKFKRRYEGDKYYRSEIIDYTWNKGNALCDTISTKSVYYVTGYLIKNQNWRHKKNPEKIFQKPFLIMSKGIGLDYFNENKEQIKEKKCKSRYYMKMLELSSKGEITSYNTYRRKKGLMKKKNISHQEALGEIEANDQQAIKNQLVKLRMAEINKKGNKL